MSAFDEWVEKNKITEYYITSDEWLTERSSGGGYWEDGVSEYEVFDIEIPEFTQLQKFLESISIELSYVEYVDLVNSIAKEDSRTDHEDYYGNFSIYHWYELTVEELYNYLKKIGKL